ncbi:androgen-dependent TFPI-regulating protein [Manduca sexta]|uniref:Androgen-dependent TFPI-regulating protein-like n=1 Tax=Manduca sexta TaxID=7130 RepID=A0A921YX67_MANSE|nr:androgen-dependent TFPI-regulating protein [Manduca sexta]KAG6447282.1 hypothetical protein O3G_MSEX004870 [Manduca sexta]
MSNHIYLRMLGYAITIPLHVTNMVVMLSSFKGEVMNDPIVYHFSQMQVFFFTCWTFIFQTVFASFSLYYDLQTLKNAHTDYKPPKIVDFIRQEAFSSIVWPSTFFVFSVFWLFFAYDRSLFYPANIDKAISDTSNHIMHTWIFPIALWEMMFYHRSKPKNSWMRLAVTWIVEVTYISTLIYVYASYGAWVYPIFGKLHGSLWFPLFFVASAGILAVAYHLQWYLYSIFWRTVPKLSEKAP